MALQFQKEVKSNPEQLSCKKVCGTKMNKDMKPKVAAKKWL